MNCDKFEEILHDLSRPGTEGFAVRETALAHAEVCGCCGELLTQAQSLDLALHALAAKEAGNGGPAHAEEELLLAEYRLRMGASSRRRMRQQIVAVGAAAVLLFALSLAIRHRVERQPTPASSAQGVSAHRIPPDADATKIVGTPGAVVGHEESKRREKRVGTVAVRARPDSEPTAAFVQLPYSDDFVPGEEGTIVRVVLSRPALASLGLPVADLGAADRISADVIVEEDGAPRAIRLVSDSGLR